MSNTIEEAMYKAILNAKKDSTTRQMFIKAMSLKPITIKGKDSV